MFLIQTYSIEVCLKYYSGEYSSELPVDITLPSEFEIDYKWTRKNTSNASGVLIGTNGSRNAYIGQYSSSGDYGIFFLNPNNPQRLSSSNINSEVNFNVKYINGQYTMSDGTNTVTVSEFQFTKILKISGLPNCPIKEVKIKQL